MESKKSTKSRSYGDASRTPNPARASLTPKSTTTRPVQRERVKSAPLVPQVPQQQQQQQQQPSSSTRSQGSNKRGSHTPDANPGALSPPLSPSNRKTTGASHRPISQSPNEGHGDVNEVVIGVLGADAVGKSTFIHLALDLKKAATSPVSSKKVSLEGLISVVRLIEVDAEDVEVEDDSLIWPETVGDEVIPPVDGALVIYNVLDPSSVTPLPLLLNALSNDRIPTIVVASNCDQSPKSWRVDHGKVERLCSQFDGVECFQTSITVSETHKRCVSIILRNVMLERNGDPCKSNRSSPPRPRAKSNIQSISRPLPAVQSAGTESRPERAASEASGSITEAASAGTPDPLLSPSSPETSWDVINEEFQEAKQWQSPRIESDCSSDGSSSSESHDSDDGPESQTTDFTEQQTPPKPDHRSSASGSRNSATKENISTGTEADKLISAKMGSNSRAEMPLKNDGEDEDEKESGASFAQLVDRLLAQPMSKSDSKFASIFLCFYRKFAAPSALLLAFIQRFEDMNASDEPELIRLHAQLRYLTILKDWISDYPGDFAHPLTRRVITSFVHGLGGNQTFAVAHKEISMHLDVISEDDDTEWACSDRSHGNTSTMESFLAMSSTHSADSPITEDSSKEEVVEQLPRLEKVQTGRSDRISSTTSTTSAAESSTNPSTTSFQVSLHSAENAQRQAQLLTPIPRVDLDKLRWHQLMDISEEQIAKELTRIDWIMYSSIRPRDIVRHISLNAEQKEKCRSLEYVNRMINQFNHVAFWVANLILLRNKPKNRAKALEKFMGVAWKLRHLNNYNSLGAVIAGINGTAVHRLSQTRELVSPVAQKQFMRLEILMGTQKSHFAYRLAWENTSTARIPFLPLHRRDLVVTEEANPTFIARSDGDLINWKKFEIMGQVIIDIRKSQQLSYPLFKKNEEVQRLVLDGTFPKDDDELYERSCQLERPGAGEYPRKKFSWFQR